MAPITKKTTATATTAVPTKKTAVPATNKPEPVAEPVKDDVASSEVDSATDEQIDPVKLFSTKINNYIASLVAMKKDIGDLISVGKTLEREFAATAKQLQKKSKAKSGGERRHPSGFAVASMLSDEMYGFLNITKGEKVPRKDVTRLINEYITKNGLRDSADKRIIKPNTELHKIFNSKDDDKITYFNLQSFIKHHFVKETAPVA